MIWLPKSSTNCTFSALMFSIKQPCTLFCIGLESLRQYSGRPVPKLSRKASAVRSLSRKGRAGRILAVMPHTAESELTRGPRIDGLFSSAPFRRVSGGPYPVLPTRQSATEADDGSRNNAGRHLERVSVDFLQRSGRRQAPRNEAEGVRPRGDSSS